MDDGATPASQLPSPTDEPKRAPTDAELSRIAREAVHQPADPRLDRHLQRMGLVDSPEPAAPTVDRDLGQPAGLTTERDAGFDLVDRRLRRLELSLVVLALAVVVLAIIEVIQLIR